MHATAACAVKDSRLRPGDVLFDSSDLRLESPHSVKRHAP